MSLKIKANFNRTTLAKQAEMYPKAGARALNEVAKQARTHANKRLREVYNIRHGALNREIKIIPANQGNLVARLTLQDKPIGLIKFSTRQVSSGVNVSIKVGSNKIIRSAFVQTMESGHKGVFVRTGVKKIAKQGRYKGKSREVIQERFTLSAADMFGSAKLAEDISQFINDNLPRIVESKLKEMSGSF